MKLVIFVIFVIANASNGVAAPAVCTTPACVKKGADIKENMDTSADPCDNFFQFACGGFTSKHEVPEYASVYGQFQALNRAVMYNMSRALSLSYEERDGMGESLYKSHSACMLGGNNVGTDNEDAWNDVMQSIGVEEWPINAGDVNIPLWSKLLGDLMVTFNYKPIVYIDVKRSHDTKENVIHLKPGSLPTEKEYLSLPYYKVLLYLLVEKLNATSLSGAQVLHAIDEMVQFETTLAEILSKQINDTTPTTASVMELESDVDLRRSMVDIYQILDHIFKTSNIAVSRNDSVLLSAPGKIRLLLKACGEWEKHIVSNVLVLHALLTVGRDVLPGVQDLIALFKNKVRHVEKSSVPQTVICNGALAQAATAAYGYFYLNNFFDNSSMPIVEEMLEFQKKIFHKELQNNDWMDNATKAAALSKLAAMSAVIGCPQWMTNESKVSLLIPKADTVRGDQFVYYYVASAKVSMQAKLGLLRKQEDPNDSETFNVALVNAFYKRTENKIVIPAAIMQQPFFDPGLPKYINYAMLGYIVFHEVSHGFDSIGRTYDERGRISDWWTPQTAQIFRDKAQCFVDLYGNITDADTKMKLPSSQTLAEDISDNAAARQSYLAFQELKKKEKESMQLLPGLESFTFEQLHFISAAQPWCKKYDPAMKKYVIKEDVHSLSEHRVNIAFGNTPQFAAAFKCPPSSKMNFAKKCKVW